MHFSPLFFKRRSLIIFHNPERCTVISRPSCFNLPVCATQRWNSSHPTLFWEPDGCKGQTDKGNRWQLNRAGSSPKFPPLKKRKKKKDWCARGVSGAEIAIRSDYPRPLTAADSMSQSGMCIINQRWLRRPLPLASSRRVRQGDGQFPAEWPNTRRAESDYWRDVAAANEHSDALNNSLHADIHQPSGEASEDGRNSDSVAVSTTSCAGFFAKINAIFSKVQLRFAGYRWNSRQISCLNCIRYCLFAVQNGWYIFLFDDL